MEKAVERTIAARRTQIRGQIGPVRATVMETETRLSRAIGSDPIHAMKLINDHGRGVTDLGDLQVESVWLDDAERALKSNRSTHGVAVPPPGQRVELNPFEDLSSRKRNAPTVISRSKNSI
jgi:hypothetical protein